MRRGSIYLILVAAAVGMGLSAYSLWHFVQLQGANLAAPSFCNINSSFNCDAVAGSSYAVQFGFPIAGFGLLFFVVQAVLAVWARMTSAKPEGIATVGALQSVLALCASLYFFYVMAAVLKTWCLTCIGIDLAVIGTLIGWWTSGGVTMQKSRLRGLLMSPMATSVALAAVGLLFLVNVSGAQSQPQPSETALANAYAAFKRRAPVPFDLSAEHLPRWGSKNPKVTIVEFSDFECPFCARAAFKLKPMLTEFRDQVQLVFAHFPLDKTCNKTMKRQMHRNACLAARASVCAEQQDKFWPLHDEIFSDYRNVNSASLKANAGKVGMDVHQYEHCLAQPQTEQAVQHDIQMAIQARVTGTPAIFINGRRMNKWTNQTWLHYVLQRELAE